MPPLKRLIVRGVVVVLVAWCLSAAFLPSSPGERGATVMRDVPEQGAARSPSCRLPGRRDGYRRAPQLEANPSAAVLLHAAALGTRLLLQVSYAHRRGAGRDFTTSRSRIIRLERRAASVQVMEDRHDPGASTKPLATIPIRGATADLLLLDFNAGFDRIFEDEDRTGEDYYAGEATRDPSSSPIRQREIARISSIGSMLLIEQRACSDDVPVCIYYYLSAYRPNTAFIPFELEDLNHFGFYQTYPQDRFGKQVFYATTFDRHKPIVFALSPAIPESHREAVREGVLYWNRVLGRSMIRVVDAPAGVTAPSPVFNIIEWVRDGIYGSTSHIQSDPLTGEILHAEVFLDGHAVAGFAASEGNDFLRYLVAHEIGHALGLRHNFAQGRRPATVMNYFEPDESVVVGRVIRSSRQGLDYDRDVMRHVYLGERLDLVSLPRFCTDYQPGCGPLFGEAGPVARPVAR